MKTRRVCRSVFFVWLFPFFFNAVIPSAQEEIPEPRGEIRIEAGFRPDMTVLGHQILQQLFQHPPDKDELVPFLAISRQWIDDTTLEVKLRQGVNFTNGEHFDAEAVKFNWDYQQKHNRGRGITVYLRNLKQIEIIDSHTIRLILSQPDALFLDRLLLGPVSGWVIGAPKYMKQIGWEEFLKKPIGTGPYIAEGPIKDYGKAAEGEVYATLVANPDYWIKGKAKIERITFVKHTPDEALRELIEGRLDLTISILPKDTLKVAESSRCKIVKDRSVPKFTTGWLNLMSPHTFHLRDIRVRKALNFAVNKEELMRYAFKGNAVEVKGVLDIQSGVDLSSTQEYEWNITKARALLKEAGYSEGFKMKIYYEKHDSLIARLLQRFFSLIKIETEITPVDWDWKSKHVVYPNIREEHSWDSEDWGLVIFSTNYAGLEPGYAMLEWFFHSGAPFQAVSDYLMQPLNTMYDEVLKTKNRNWRFEIYRKANEYIADQAFWVFTMAPITLYAVNSEVNFVPADVYLYLDYCSVTDNHWSLRGKNN